MFRLTILPAALAALTACGGASTSNPPPVSTTAEFRALQSDVNNTRFQNGFNDTTAFNDLPTSGSASYDGVAVFKPQDNGGSTGNWAGNDPSLMARMNLNANFGSSTISGEIDRFHNAKTGERLDGTLVLNGGLSNDANGVIRGSVAGRMATLDGQTEAGGQFFGNFTDNIDGVSGGMTVNSPKGTWNGLFEGQRD